MDLSASTASDVDGTMSNLTPADRPHPVRAKSDDATTTSKASVLSTKTQVNEPTSQAISTSHSDDGRQSSNKINIPAAEAFDQAIRRMENFSSDSQNSHSSNSTSNFQLDEDDAFTTVYGPDPAILPSPSNYGAAIYPAPSNNFSSSNWNTHQQRFEFSPPARAEPLSPYHHFVEYQAQMPSPAPHPYYPPYRIHQYQDPQSSQGFYHSTVTPNGAQGYVVPISPSLMPTSPVSHSYQLPHHTHVPIVSPSPQNPHYYHQVAHQSTATPFLAPLSPIPHSPSVAQHQIHPLSHHQTPSPHVNNNLVRHSPPSQVFHVDQFQRTGRETTRGGKIQNKNIRHHQQNQLQQQQQQFHQQQHQQQQYNVYQSFQPMHFPPTNQATISSPYQPHSSSNSSEYKLNPPVGLQSPILTTTGSPVSFPTFQMLPPPYSPYSPLSPPPLGHIPLSPGPVFSHPQSQNRTPQRKVVESSPGQLTPRDKKLDQIQNQLNQSTSSKSISKNSRAQQPLARGHLAQAKLRGAIFGTDEVLESDPMPMTMGPTEKERKLKAALPKPPMHSEFAMWVGNLPSDSSHSELWSFFTNRSPPILPPDCLEGIIPETMNAAGVESIHLISRSNCAFVNYATKFHLEHAITSCNGLPLRNRDPRCKPLVCRVRKREDDAKSGVGAQRGSGMHRHWVAERKARGIRTGEDSEVITGSQMTVPTDGTASVTVGVAVPPPTSQTQKKMMDTERETQINEVGKKSSSSTTQSTESTTSSFLGRNFPIRYFILKSHTEDDLHLSVKRNKWATQSHNEVVLDQAFRTSQVVYLIFGANKSGEFFGYAKMASPILTDQSRMSWTREGNNGSTIAKPDEKRKESNISTSRPIFLSPNDQKFPIASPSVITPQATASPAALTSSSSGPTPDLIHSEPLPLKPVSDTKDHVTSISVSGPDYFSLASATKLNRAPIVTNNDIEKEKAASEPPPSALSMGGNSNIVVTSTSEPIPQIRHENGINEIWNPTLPAEERNAQLDTLEEEFSDMKMLDKSWGKPFDIEWVKVERLPFNRTRHLRNPWNGAGREVKISRDGTELEPGVGEALLQEFHKMSISQPVQFDSGDGVPLIPTQSYHPIPPFGHTSRTIQDGLASEVTSPLSASSEL